MKLNIVKCLGAGAATGAKLLGIEFQLEGGVNALVLQHQKQRMQLGFEGAKLKKGGVVLAEEQTSLREWLQDVVGWKIPEETRFEVRPGEEVPRPMPRGARLSLYPPQLGGSWVVSFLKDDRYKPLLRLRPFFRGCSLWEYLMFRCGARSEILPRADLVGALGAIDSDAKEPAKPKQDPKVKTHVNMQW